MGIAMYYGFKSYYFVVIGILQKYWRWIAKIYVCVSTLRDGITAMMNGSEWIAIAYVPPRGTPSAKKKERNP